MPRLTVDPGQLRATSAGILRAGSELAVVPGLASGLDGGLSRPSSTAAAVADLGQAWSNGAQTLQAELEALGGSADAAAFFYADTDVRSMAGEP